MNRQPIVLIALLLIFCIIGIPGSGCMDIPLKAQAKITGETIDIRTLEIKNENWFDWTEVDMVLYSQDNPTCQAVRFPLLYRIPRWEAGKTQTVNFYTGINSINSTESYVRWDGKIGSMRINANTILGWKSGLFYLQ